MPDVVCGMVRAVVERIGSDPHVSVVAARPAEVPYHNEPMAVGVDDLDLVIDGGFRPKRKRLQRSDLLEPSAPNEVGQELPALPAGTMKRAPILKAHAARFVTDTPPAIVTDEHRFKAPV